MVARKLTKEDVAHIRECADKRRRLRELISRLSNRALAKVYNVSYATIERVIHGEIYKKK